MELTQMAASSRGWLAERAQIALELQQQHAQGDISDSEYQELMEDLARSDTLNEEADDQELKNALVSAIMMASKLA